MSKIVKINVSNKDYFKCLNMVEKYNKDYVTNIYFNENETEIKIKCGIFGFKKLKHDVDLAIKLGMDVKMEA